LDYVPEKNLLKFACALSILPLLIGKLATITPWILGICIIVKFYSKLGKFLNNVIEKMGKRVGSSGDPENSMTLDQSFSNHIHIDPSNHLVLFLRISF